VTPDRSISFITVISPISSETGNGLVNLIKQSCKLTDVAAVLIAQDFSDDFTRISIYAKMQFAPLSLGFAAMLVLKPLACAINIQSRAVDKNMNGFMACIYPVAIRSIQKRQIGTASAQCRMIRHW